MHRVITGLKWAVEVTQPPFNAMVKRRAKNARGACKAGYAYENQVGRFIKRKVGGSLFELKSGQWFSFVDVNGSGWAQTDHFLISEDYVILIECKLTQQLHNAAFLQMSQLYMPLLEHIYKLPICSVQTCKNIRYKPECLVELNELMESPVYGNSTWHFLGR